MENNYLRWLTSQTKSIYWNDSANLEELDEAIKNGAKGVTTNPVIIQNALITHPEHWQPLLKNIPSDLMGEDLAMERTKRVVVHLAEKLKPIFDKGVVGEGYVCAQVNPNYTFDSAYMVDWAKKIQSWAPNISVKLPATKAGLEAYEQCIALGINVTGTIGFTVPQCLAMGEARKRGVTTAIKNGIKPGLAIAVMMVGRLDDYLREVSKDSGLNISESDILQAGIICFKRAYALCKERGYDVYLMPAGLRSTAQITEIAGAEVIMSIGPKIADDLANSKEEKRMEIASDEDVIKRLLKLKEFRKAYEPDGLSPDEFITYGVVNRTTIGFIDNGWNPLVTK